MIFSSSISDIACVKTLSLNEKIEASGLVGVAIERKEEEGVGGGGSSPYFPTILLI